MTTAVNIWALQLGSRIARETRAMLTELARNSPCAEVCGFIIEGPNRPDPNGALALNVVVADNTSDNPGNSFRISADDTIRVYEQYGNLIVGIFHTHPSGRLTMSQRDIDSAAEIYRAGCPWAYVIATSHEVVEYRYVG